MIDIDDSERPAVGAGSALADLQAIARRSGDPALSSAVRRVAWQMAPTADRCAGAEASAQSLSARLDVIIAQRDEAVTALRTSGLPARLKKQADELPRSHKCRGAALLPLRSFADDRHTRRPPI